MANLEYEGFISLFSRLGYKDMHKCNYCQYFCKSIFFMRNHVRRHRSSKKTFNCERNDLELFQCTDCNFKTEVFMFLKKHIKDVHRSDQDNANGSTTYAMKSYTCQMCSYEKYSLLQWVRHDCFEVNLIDCNNGGKCGSLQMADQFACDLYPYKSKRKDYLVRHYSLKHISGDKINRFKNHKLHQHASEKDIVWLECDQCSFKAKTNGVLKRHKNGKHTSEKDIVWFECDQCSFKAKTKYELKSHKLHRHTSEKDIVWFECDQCSFKAKTNGELTRHKNRKHASEKDIVWFECDQCSYKAKTNCELKRHKNGKHASEKDIVWFDCHQCPYKAKTNDNLKKHKMRKHTSEKDMAWFECDQCSLKTKINADLKRHKMRKHSSEKDCLVWM